MSDVIKIRDLAARHLPKIFFMTKDKVSIWNKVQSKFEKKLDNIKVGEEFENSIPILLGKAELGDDISIRFLAFIDQTLSIISNKLPHKLYPQFISMIGRFINEFDVQRVERPNPTYLNSYAEFLAVLRLLESDSYELISFEKPISNGKRIDFELKNKQTGEWALVDVVSVHVPNKKAINRDLLRLTLDTKLDDKFSSKTEGLIKKDGIYILPILWFEDSIKNEILDHLSNTDLNQRSIIEPCALVQYTTTEKIEFMFSTISSLYN